MRNQIASWILLPILVLLVFAVGAQQTKEDTLEYSEREKRRIAELNLNPQISDQERFRMTTMERLQYEDVVIFSLPHYPRLLDLQSLAKSASGVILARVIAVDYVLGYNHSKEPSAYTDYRVAIEDDFGNPLKGCEAGKEVTLRSSGGKVKVGNHFLDVRVPDEPKLMVGQRAIIFLALDDVTNNIWIYGPAVFFLEGESLRMENLTLGSCPFAKGKSAQEIMTEIRALAPLLGTALQK